MIRTGGGLFDPAHRPVYFVAVGSGHEIGVNTDRAFPYPWVLVATGDLSSVEKLGNAIGPDTRLLLDSGAFAVAAAFMRDRGISMGEALSTAPADIPGFAKLRAMYVALVRRWEDRLWGYIELDLGTTDMKRETRAGLEAEGLRPIPVYTPLNDGWAYLDELLTGYDRIAVGGLVGMPTAMRRAVLVTIWERARRTVRTPWIHVLGFTPSPLFLACPFDSCDSTQHLASVRLGSAATLGRAMLGSLGALDDPGFSLNRADKEGPAGKRQAADLLAFVAESDLRCWDRARLDLSVALGEDLAVYPPPVLGERSVLPASMGLG